MMLPAKRPASAVLAVVTCFTLSLSAIGCSEDSEVGEAIKKTGEEISEKARELGDEIKQRAEEASERAEGEEGSNETAKSPDSGEKRAQQQ